MTRLDLLQRCCLYAAIFTAYSAAMEALLP